MDKNFLCQILFFLQEFHKSCLENFSKIFFYLNLSCRTIDRMILNFVCGLNLFKTKSKGFTLAGKDFCKKSTDTYEYI